MKNTKKLQELFEAMLSRKHVTIITDKYQHPYLIQRIDLDGEVDLYSECYEEIIAHNEPYKNIKLAK